MTHSDGNRGQTRFLLTWITSQGLTCWRLLQVRTPLLGARAASHLQSPPRHSLRTE